MLNHKENVGVVSTCQCAVVSVGASFVHTTEAKP